MPSILSELKTYLKTKSAVTNLVGATTAARIYQYTAKEGVAMPYVVLDMVPGESHEHLGGITGIARNRIIIDAYAATELASYALAEAIRLILQPIGKDGTRPTFGSTVVHGIASDGSYEADFEPPVKGGAQKRYVYSRDYFISYAEAVSA